MFDNTMPPVEIAMSEIRVPTPDGHLFVKRWQPQTGAGNAPEKAPIVLMHDSLGSVALWRDFPEQLSQQAVKSLPMTGWALGNPMPTRISWVPALSRAR